MILGPWAHVQPDSLVHTVALTRFRGSSQAERQAVVAASHCQPIRLPIATLDASRPSADALVFETTTVAAPSSLKLQGNFSTYPTVSITAAYPVITGDDFRVSFNLAA